MLKNHNQNPRSTTAKRPRQSGDRSIGRTRFGSSWKQGETKKKDDNRAPRTEIIYRESARKSPDPRIVVVADVTEFGTRIAGGKERTKEKKKKKGIDEQTETEGVIKIEHCSIELTSFSMG